MKTEVKGTIFDWETVKEYLYPVLLPLKTAQKMDSTTARVYRKWLDIAIAYAVRMVDETNKLVDHINVRQSLLIMWGVDEETLYQQAMKNLYKEQYEVKKLWDVLMELSKKTSELPEIECPADVDILILSNSYLSYFKTINGGYRFEVMGKSAVDSYAQQYSNSYTNEDSPWKNNYESMAKKTVIRQLLKYTPMQSDLQRAISMDETVNCDLAIDIAELQDDKV